MISLHIGPILLLVLILVVCGIASPVIKLARKMNAYNSICLNLTNEPTPDPYVISWGGNYYMLFTARYPNWRIEVWKAASLPDLSSRPERHVLWEPKDEDNANFLWAPELHSLNGRWYIYFAAAHPALGNKSHRMYVLGGPPADQDPVQGPWEFLGPIAGMDQRQWAIDGTIIILNHSLYFVYSGWPLGVMDSEATQELFILHLSDPVTADSQPMCICQPHEPWEKSGGSNINEGPQFLQAQDRSWTGLVYSCAGSWTPDYKMNTLQYIGGDPLLRTSWNKGTKPLIKNNGRGVGPYGPGHGSFLHIGLETVGIFHATDSPRDGQSNRKARMQRVVFVGGQPYMGSEVGPTTTEYSDFVGESSGFLEFEPITYSDGATGSDEKTVHGKTNDEMRDETKGEL